MSGMSTSDVLARIISGYRQGYFDKKLEGVGRGELKAEGSVFEDRRNAS
jgi:choline-phosphate cytidylyltransferase